MKSNLKIAALLVVLAGVSSAEGTITFSQFLREVQAGKVKKVSISDGAHVEGQYRDRSAGFETVIPAHYPEIYKVLQDKGVEIEILGRGWVSVLINASPFLLLLAFWVFMMRQMKNGRWRSY